ncbi:unnamed protein product [Vitrella brassicaformis CCMP3155]|uniref:Uncharacterized protein n=2 Tax=Vitrella brassicaformis TaxID=1169539 RepID=A0A0G4FLF9_VITBC|nr:unnamed protein product [Vitrella brassicaformis CCMP3155]|eukprot:CEM14603.1 unnamed protein product [Vitrella brassicaformis CCMP3155]
MALQVPPPGPRQRRHRHRVRAHTKQEPLAKDGAFFLTGVEADDHPAMPEPPPPPLSTAALINRYKNIYWAIQPSRSFVPAAMPAVGHDGAVGEEVTYGGLMEDVEALSLAPARKKMAELRGMICETDKKMKRQKSELHLLRAGVEGMKRDLIDIAAGEGEGGAARGLADSDRKRALPPTTNNTSSSALEPFSQSAHQVARPTSRGGFFRSVRTLTALPAPAAMLEDYSPSAVPLSLERADKHKALPSLSPTIATGNVHSVSKLLHQDTVGASHTTRREQLKAGARRRSLTTTTADTPTA